jgi:hypothetical protein
MLVNFKCFLRPGKIQNYDFTDSENEMKMAKFPLPVIYFPTIRGHVKKSKKVKFAHF